MSYMKNLCNVVADLRSLADHIEAAFSTDLEPTQPVTLEAVRAVLTDKSMAGKGDKVRELLGRHGANKLSEIDPSHYAALLASAKAIV